MLSFLVCLFILVIVVQISYYGLLFSQFSFAKEETKSNEKPFVSILIACRNEAKNLQKNLPIILDSDYPNFEIILVDDASSDDTFSCMQDFQKENKNLKIIQIPKTATYNGNKKNAITQAIAQAEHEHLLFTDADCIPQSNSWISEMAAHFTTNKQLVLGYGAYKKNRGWLNKLIRFETLFTAWQYFSYAKVGKPYMGVGRNIAYTKSLFEKEKGFESHQTIRSGDDDLFVNQVGTKDNTAFCWQSESFTVSEPKTSLSAWLKQKRRHITTANSYKSIHQLLLGVFYISQLLFMGLAFVLLILNYEVKTVLILIVLRYIIYFISFIPASKKLKENDLVLWAPFLELFLIVLQMRIFITNLWEKPKEW